MNKVNAEGANNDEGDEVSRGNDSIVVVEDKDLRKRVSKPSSVSPGIRGAGSFL